MATKCVCSLLIVIICAVCVILDARYSDISNEVICRTPRYAPYFWVRNISSTSMQLGVTDPNEPSDVTSYTVYYWGHRVGRETSSERADRHFGQRVMSTDGPFLLSDLRANFAYCADVTANNQCGHGPFCMACFENVATLDS